ncbi:MAG: hypothetical protein ABJE47_21765 [bacterium]
MRIARLLFTLIATPVALFAQAPHGSITTVTSIDSGAGTTPHVITTRARIADGLVRLDMSMPTGGPAEGAYMLMNAKSDTVLTILPSQKMAMIAPSAGSAMGTLKLVKRVLVGEPTYAMEDLGDGPLIVGLHTRHYRTTEDYTMAVTIGDQPCTKKVHTVTDMWRSTETTLPGAVERMTTASFVGADAIASDTSMAKLRALHKTVPGAVLRMDSMGGDGTHNHMEITELSSDPVDPASLKLPAGYSIMDSRPMQAAMMDQPAMKDMMLASLRKNMCSTPKP